MLQYIAILVFALITEDGLKFIVFQEAKYQFHVITTLLVLASISHTESIISIDLDTYCPKVFQVDVFVSFTSVNNQTLI